MYRRPSRRKLGGAATFFTQASFPWLFGGGLWCIVATKWQWKFSSEKGWKPFMDRGARAQYIQIIVCISLYEFWWCLHFYNCISYLDYWFHALLTYWFLCISFSNTEKFPLCMAKIFYIYLNLILIYITFNINLC